MLQLLKKGLLETVTWYEKGKKCTANFANRLMLNGQYQDILVNHFECIEIDEKSGQQIFYNSNYINERYLSLYYHQKANSYAHFNIKL